jgi:hypothetical protein
MFAYCGADSSPVAVSIELVDAIVAQHPRALLIDCGGALRRQPETLERVQLVGLDTLEFSAAHDISGGSSSGSGSSYGGSSGSGPNSLSALSLEQCVRVCISVGRWLGADADHVVVLVAPHEVCRVLCACAIAHCDGDTFSSAAAVAAPVATTATSVAINRRSALDALVDVDKALGRASSLLFFVDRPRTIEPSVARFMADFQSVVAAKAVHAPPQLVRAMNVDLHIHARFLSNSIFIHFHALFTINNSV